MFHLDFDKLIDMKLYFIGYKCSGKTTTGSLLATKLGLDFIDLDNYIEKKYDKTIPDLFILNDELMFRQIERKAFLEVSDKDNFVLATGGGFPCWFNNMELLKQSGVTIYLKVNANILYNRMRIVSSHRPILKGQRGYALRHYIKMLTSKHEHIYNQAHITHENNVMEIDSLMEKITTYNNAFILN
jgi:shikimate kinase